MDAEEVSKKSAVFVVLVLVVELWVMLVVEYVVLLVVEFDVWAVYVDVVVVWVGEALIVRVLDAESPAWIPDAVIV